MKKIIAFVVSALVLSSFISSAVQAQNTAANQNKKISPSEVTKEQIEAFQMMYALMKPEQKAMITEEVRKQAAKIQPEQKEAVIQRARQHYNSLNAEQKATMRTQLLQLGAKLTPEQKAEFLSRLEE